MVFSRTQRLDRRRRLVRESAAMDSAVSADYARTQKKTKRSQQSDHDAILSGIDTPNYSQDVRKPCQQRIVQWIPVRTSSLAMMVGGCWLIWGLLLVAHYLLHTNANSISRSPTPAAQLFDLRSPHSIANWMTCQLWFLTAFASWMAYSIRQHRLDDFSATYRVWGLMIGLSLFSCFDTATQATYLIGQSIDPWTRREIGYGGWPLFLAAYASIVALVGLRLSSEMRISRAAIALWFSGLLAWGCAALLGTGLLKIQWSPGLIDLVVGGCWLGGVLAIFQAIGLVLRKCYMQAQKRFLERTALSKQKRNWEEMEDSSTSDEEEFEASDKDNEESPAARKSWLPWKRKSASDAIADEDSDEDAPTTKDKSATKSVETTPKKPMRLFGLFPHRSERNEQLSGAEPIRVEDQLLVDQGLTKKQGWFSKSGATTKQSTSAESKTVAKQSSEGRSSVIKNDQAKSSDDASVEKAKRSWLGSVLGRSASSRNPEDDPSRESSMPKSTSARSSTKDAIADESGVAEPKAKKGLFAFRTNKSTSPVSPNTSDAKNTDSKSASSRTQEGVKPKVPETVESFEILEEEAPRSGKLAKKLFGWFDGLKLKPPKDTSPIKTPESPAGQSKTTAANATSNPVAGSNVAQSSDATTSKPTQPRNEYDDEDSDDDYSDYRNLSKAERKRLRRQQNDRGAA